MPQRWRGLARHEERDLIEQLERVKLATQRERILDENFHYIMNRHSRATRKRNRWDTLKLWMMK